MIRVSTLAFLRHTQYAQMTLKSSLAHMITDDIFEWLQDQTDGRGSRNVEGLFHLASDVGPTRDDNQDRVAVLRVGSKNQTFWCACLCDGMGGMRDGGRAASLSVSAFFSQLIAHRRLQPKERLRLAAIEASQRVASDVAGGGATLSAVLFERSETFLLNVGDSRIFEVSRGKVVRRTVDDTMEEAYGSEGRDLLQFVGMRSGLSPHVDQLLETPDRILITSDGAHVIGEDVLGGLVNNADHDETLASRLLSVAGWTSGRDNASVIVARAQGPDFNGWQNRQSDISIWTLQGRMKIAWPSPVTAEPSPQSSSKLQVLPDQPAPSPQVKSTDLPIQELSASKRRKSKKAKVGQIEIGFSDDKDSGQ